MLSSLSSTIMTVFDIPDLSTVPRAPGAPREDHDCMAGFAQASPGVVASACNCGIRTLVRIRYGNANPDVLFIQPTARRVRIKAINFSSLRTLLRAFDRFLTGRRSSPRRGRRYIHGTAAEREIERIAAEQVDDGDEDQQEGRLPALRRADQLRLAEHHDQHDRERNLRGHAVHHADEAVAGRGQAEWNRDELVGQIEGGEP